MKHARSDYDKRIVDLEGKIPEDEPVFLLRGQDQLAPKLLMMWASDLLLKGGDPTMAESAMMQARRMLKWQKDHGVKTPDMYFDPAKKQSKDIILGIINQIKVNPVAYSGTMPNQLFNAMSMYYDTSRPPLAVVGRTDLLESSKDKPIEELSEFDLDYIEKVDMRNYKLIIFIENSKAYIIDNKIQ